MPSVNLKCLSLAIALVAEACTAGVVVNQDSSSWFPGYGAAEITLINNSTNKSYVADSWTTSGETAFSFDPTAGSNPGATVKNTPVIIPNGNYTITLKYYENRATEHWYVSSGPVTINNYQECLESDYFTKKSVTCQLLELKLYPNGSAPPPTKSDAWMTVPMNPILF